LASELWPGKHSPTITHSFIALLERKGVLLRTYTQNIDGLDVLAGVSEEKMIECHGHFRTASCISCNFSSDGEECKRIIVEEKRPPPCQNCGGHVKPDIVFFGESLPTVFHRNVRKDTKNADLLIVMGTCEYLWASFYTAETVDVSKPHRNAYSVNLFHPKPSWLAQSTRSLKWFGKIVPVFCSIMSW